MGRLIYRDRASFDIDDRILAHLRIVVMNKLRRNEGFMLQLPVNEGVRQASLWIHASNALVLQFYGGREPAIDRALDEEFGVFELGRPRSCTDAELALRLPLEETTLRRKVEALLAQESQTAGLVSAVGRERFARWVATETFAPPAEPRARQTG